MILVASCSWIVGDEDSFLRKSLRGNTNLLSSLSVTPGEVIDVLLQKLPSLTKILSDIKFFVDLARVIAEFLAIGPCGCESPSPFSRMELEFVDLLS